MTTIAVDAALRCKLLAAGGIAEFREEDGAMIGQFIPSGESEGEEDPQIGLADELQRRLAPDCQTYTTSEVLAHLRGLK